MERTIEELNSLPLNEKAKKMLVLVGEEPKPESIYCVQLAIWGITKNHIEVEEGIKEFILAMSTWSPARLMNFFMLPYNDIDREIDWDNMETPKELACAIINFIEEKIAIHFPFYFSVE